MKNVLGIMDLYEDDKINVLDLCIMKRELIK